MKRRLIISILFVSQLGFAQKESSVQPFLPNIFKQFPSVRDFTISSSQDEAFFTAQSYLGELSVIINIKKEKGKWSEPEIAPFSGGYQDLEPFLAPDGLRLYFASNRPLSDTTNKAKDFDIWYVQRENRNSGWLSPINIGPPINTENNEFYPSVATNNNLYFTSDANSKGKDDIFFSEWQNGHYSIPASLSDSINSDGYEFNAYVAPDESFIIFSGYNRGDGLGSGDLYISYQNTNGLWSKARNLGSEINSDRMDYCPFIDMNRKTLYFTSKRSHLDYSPSGFKTINELLSEMNKYENGSSRIYKVSMEQILINR
jgi:hypothetical protein